MGSTPSDSGELTVEDLRRFPDFPLYGALDSLAGFPLTEAHRASPGVLAQTGTEPVETIGAPESRSGGKGDVVSDFVALIYGDCDASAGGCSPPLQIQIWRACNRYIDDYELAPGTPLPHESLTVRGTRAARFSDRLEVYAGSVTVVIFADPKLANRAADELQPLNALAEAEAGGGAGRSLPASEPGPNCA